MKTSKKRVEITDELLCKQFPHLFKDRHAPMNQTAFCFGFEVGQGWMGIIYEAASKIEPLIVKLIDDAIANKDLESLNYIPTTSQIKEKFGTLRWYLTSSTDEMEKIIGEAEKKSAKTCEECGKAGKLRGKVWFSIRCNKCWKKQKAKYGK